MFSKGPENLKPEEDRDLDEYSRNLKKFEDSNTNGDALSAFGNMLEKFISGKNLKNPEQKDIAENTKRDTINQAKNILNDSTLNADGKNTALARLFGTFQENKDAFPQEQNQSQQVQNTEKQKTEEFLEGLLEVIGDNRKTSEARNQNIANKVAKDTASPSNGGPGYPPSPAENPVFAV